MAVTYPQLDGVRIGPYQIPLTVIQAIRKAYDYILELQNSSASGLDGLDTINVIPKVIAPGTLGDSAVSDDGIKVLIAARPLQVNTGTDQNLDTVGPITLATGNTVQAMNDAHNANQPLEFRASQFAFEVGKVGIGLGATAPTYPADVVGDINTTTLYRVGGAFALGPAATVNLSAQNANIATTNLRPTGVLAPVGMYLLQFYFRVTTAGAAGTLNLNLTWNDGSGSHTATIGVSAAATTPPSFLALPIYTAGAADITYSTSGITAGCVYMLKLKLTQQF